MLRLKIKDIKLRVKSREIVVFINFFIKNSIVHNA